MIKIKSCNNCFSILGEDDETCPNCGVSLGSTHGYSAKELRKAGGKSLEEKGVSSKQSRRFKRQAMFWMYFSCPLFVLMGILMRELTFILLGGFLFLGGLMFLGFSRMVQSANRKAESRQRIKKRIKAG